MTPGTAAVTSVQRQVFSIHEALVSFVRRQVLSTVPFQKWSILDTKYTDEVAAHIRSCLLNSEEIDSIRELVVVSRTRSWSLLCCVCKGQV